MPRIDRMIIKDEPAVYHIMSRNALNGFMLGELEEEYLLALTKKIIIDLSPFY